MEALACGHVARRGASRICAHLVRVADEDFEAVAYLTGRGLEHDFCCSTCDEVAQAGGRVTWFDACEGCVDRLIDNENPIAWRGHAGVNHRPEPIDTTLVRTVLPDGFAADLADFAAMPGQNNEWLLLTGDGRLGVLDADTGRIDRHTRVALPGEPAAPLGTAPTPRVQVDPSGRYAALVNDYGRYGVVIALPDGRVTMSLDRGSYHPEHTRFPIAFLSGGDDGVVVVHATDWNRLDVSEPSNGRLLTDRQPTSYTQGEARPEHYLDYFHGQLLPSPDGQWIADSGWVWHPMGVPSVWNARRWVTHDVWESDDGASRRSLTQRAYYWDHPICWITDDLLAVSGIGTDDEAMLDGVRVFDVVTGQETIAFGCPVTELFADARRLYATSATSLQVWDPRTGELTATIEGFAPTRQHRGAGHLAAIEDASLVRWPIPSGRRTAERN